VAVTISLYNHTARRFASGANAAANTYKVALYTAATFNATNTTLAGITKTEVASANGYTAGGVTLANVDVTTVGTNGAKFDADNASWTASSGNIAAEFAVLYNDTDSGKAPLVFIDFGQVETASDGTEFLIVWDANGIFTWTVS
jgi:hypothetical protein